MKRVLIASALILLVAGCRNSNTVDQLQLRPGAEGDSVTILAPLSTGLTRTTLQNDAGTYNVYWTLSDSIGVFSTASTNTKFTLNETGVSTVAFQGTISGTPTCAYYPYSATAGGDPEAVSLNLPETQIQTGCNPDMENDVKVGIRNGGDRASGYTFSFTQKLTLLHFIITPDATLDGDALQSVSLLVSGKKLAGDYTLDITTAGNTPVFGVGASDIVTLTFAGTPTLTAGSPVEGWMFINPDIPASSPLTITVTTDKHIAVTTSATAGEAFDRGALYEIDMDIDALYGVSKVEITLNGGWYTQTDGLGLYTLSVADYSEAHVLSEYADQYCYSTSSGNYSFTVQGLKNGKLSRLTAASSELDADADFSATLYTIHGASGAVSETATWHVVKRDGTKYWVEKTDGSQGFVLLKLED